MCWSLRSGAFLEHHYSSLLCYRYSSGSKSSFQMKVNVAFHLEIKVPESGGRVERHRIHVA